MNREPAAADSTARTAASSAPEGPSIELVREQFARARAEFQQAQLREVLAQTPAAICVTRGAHHVIELVNEEYRKLLGGRDVVGRTAADALADVAFEQADLRQSVYQTGEPYRGTEVRAMVEGPNGPEPRYFNFIYQPLRDDAGIVYGLMTHAVDVTEQVLARRALVAQNQLATLLAQVGLVLTRSAPLRQTLQECAEAVVEYTDAAFARIWTLNEAEQLLELQASAGMYNHTDGAHGRVPVGQLKIGLIAAERKAHLTNRVVGDPQISDQQWARREGMVAFAGYPLMVGNDVVGVLALFARHTLMDSDLRALGAVAHGVALGIRRKQQEAALQTRAEELSLLAAALERSNRELDAFAYAASHDLRAPLRGIANLAQWIEEDMTASGPLKEETREMLQLMRGRMHRMEALIEGILEYSRAGRVRQAPEAVNVAKLVRDVIELLSPPHNGTIDIAPDLPALFTERLPLQQVFMNLISNALKYANRDAPVVRIGGRDEGRFWQFWVEDNGPGIAPQYHDRIWGIFQTLDARDKVEGTGIGLSLVKKLVESQGGRAWVESEPGRGATFRFLWRK